MSNEKEKKLSVLLVDDHQVLRMGLAAVLEVEADIWVVAQASDGRRAIELYQEHKPDVVLLDLRMPGFDGIETLEELRKLNPGVKVVVLTTYSGDADVHRALKAGARGYLLKTTSAPDIIAAVRKVNGGDLALPVEVAAQLAKHMNMPKLTPRELDVLRLLINGRTNGEIGADLKLTEGTVKIHMHHLFEKLGVRDRTHAVISALQRGLIHLD